MREYFKVTYSIGTHEYVLGYYLTKDAVRFGVSHGLPAGGVLGKIVKVMQ